MSFRYRDVQLLDDNPIDDSGTKAVDLNVEEPITELTVNLELTNDTSIVHDAPVDSIISKIEIVDGGQVYSSLIGQEAVAAACFDTGHWPKGSYNESLSEHQRLAIPFRFGRWLGDPSFAFSAPRLDNPQLKVTWAKNAGHLAGSLTLGVLAKVMEDLAAPAQALLWQDVDAFTSAASGAHDTLLPHDYPYRRLLIRAYKSDTIPESIISHFRLDCDMKKFQPFDLDQKEFAFLMRNFFGCYEYKKMDRCSQNSYDQTWMGGETFAAIACDAVGNYPVAWATGSIMYQQISAITANTRCEALIRGFLPHCCYCHQFGDPDVPDQWFPTLDYKQEILWLTQGAASAAVSVAVQQPRPLP